MSYASFAQKPRTSCPELTSAAFCVERHCYILHIVCFCFPAESNHCPCDCKGKKKLKKSLSVFFRVSKKSVAFLFRVFCSVFTSCLRATHANRLTESCVPRSSVAVLDFITSLQLFLHIFALKCAIRDCFCYHLTSL